MKKLFLLVGFAVFGLTTTNAQEGVNKVIDQAKNGGFYVAIGIDNVRMNLQPETGFDHIEIIEIGVELERTGPFGTRDVAPFDFDVRDLDLVVTFRNMHNFTSEGRANINAAVFESLGSGGLYGVIDHTARHMEPLTNENRRRTDVVGMIL